MWPPGILVRFWNWFSVNAESELNKDLLYCFRLLSDPCHARGSVLINQCPVQFTTWLLLYPDKNTLSSYNTSGHFRAKSIFTWRLPHVCPRALCVDWTRSHCYCFQIVMSNCVSAVSFSSFKFKSKCHPRVTTRRKSVPVFELILWTRDHQLCHSHQLNGIKLFLRAFHTRPTTITSSLLPPSHCARIWMGNLSGGKRK